MRVPGNLSFGMSLAMMRFFMTVLGEQIHTSRSLDTGREHSWPFSGSRKSPEAHEEAAPVGLPSLTVT